MLMYQRPACRSAAWASVNVAEPLAGLVGLVPIMRATGAFAPGAAGPWEWAMVGGAVSPSKLMSQVKSLVAGSKVTTAVPVPLLSVGVVTFCALITDLYVIVSATAALANTNADSASPIETL